MKKTPNGTEFDGKIVHLPKSTTLGFSTNKAKPGCWIKVSEFEYPCIVLGRVSEGIHTGNLVVLALSLPHGFLFERWIEPSDVIECYERRPVDLLSFIMTLDEHRCSLDAAQLLRDAHGGWLAQTHLRTYLERSDEVPTDNAGSNRGRRRCRC